MDVDEMRDWLAAEARASEHPYVQEVSAAILAELDRRGATIERARELHQRQRHFPYCVTCPEEDGWPCPTRQALDGSPS